MFLAEIITKLGNDSFLARPVVMAGEGFEPDGDPITITKLRGDDPFDGMVVPAAGGVFCGYSPVPLM